MKPTHKCGNTGCKHHDPQSPNGCKLFLGEAWRRCRLAKPVPTNPPAKVKQQEKYNGKKNQNNDR